MLFSAPLLIHPNNENPFIVLCNTSSHEIGAILTQYNDNNIERPISYMSKKLNKPQHNYTVAEIESLAFFIILKFQIYIEEHPFKVVTDHVSLRRLINQSDLSGRLARSPLKLQRYIFKTKNRRGSQNIVPETLSRSFEKADFVDDIDKYRKNHYLVPSDGHNSPTLTAKGSYGADADYS